MTGVRIRPATCADLVFLERMLYEALFVPPGMVPFPDTITRVPALARYFRDFGSLEGDIGFIAMDADGGAVGAAWTRCTSLEEPGFGFVDGDTPEVSIAVAPDRRGNGIGSLLLEALVEACPRLSLSVDDRNPAVSLYERFGFAVVDHEQHSLVMLRDG